MKHQKILMKIPDEGGEDKQPIEYDAMRIKKLIVTTTKTF